MQQGHSKGMQPHTTTLLGHNKDMTRDTMGRIYFVRYAADIGMLSAGTSATTRSSSSSSRRRLMRHQAPRQQLASRKRRQQKFTSPHPHQEIASSTYQASWTSAAVSAASHERASSNSSNLSWLGFVYAGELASSGFGANSAGIGFSLNAVFPAVPLMPGISRNFVLRHLLQARSIKEALAIIARPGQAVGHSYNLFDLHSRRLLNVEVGPGGHKVLEVARGSFYSHANMFEHLVAQQRVDNSSFHREARALQLQAPRDAGELLGMLGDTADPIFRHGNSTADSAVVTLCTALFDLEAGTLRVWSGNPGQARSRRLQLQWHGLF
ncbi:acyl-coenzyme A:6-aminopenicillanic acid acyl-transferase-domain-containing protein [Scenedesmus sp. NREL 46B-D3]|nr:acyl-coenzyme A:6-aminopenicillanic acid acyl-transferase-domain-containing protein [Scenedesmus sp. NREL 46B-D3]